MLLELYGHPVSLEIDTGAAVTIISDNVKKQLFPTTVLDKTDIKLRTYTSKPIPVVGQMSVSVKYGDYQGRHILYVVKGDGPALLGREWLSDIKLDWSSIKAVFCTENRHCIEQLCDKYREIFQVGPGAMTQMKAHLTIRPDATPIFRRPHSVPFSIKDIMGKELDRLEETGVLRRVEYCDWAAPVVPVPKRHGSIRLCGDYKVTINPHLQVDQYPLPRPSDLFTCLTGGKSFTKLDLASAYQQMELDDESAKLVTINTHQGLYEFRRLPFGMASAPALFQRAVDTILQGIPFVICYLDDILVSGRTKQEHHSNLEEVFRRLKHHGVRLKKEKCSFFQPSVEYLGHCIDAQGVHTSAKKVKAIVDQRLPRNVTFVPGYVKFYIFLPNLSSVLHPLHK